MIKNKSIKLTHALIGGLFFILSCPEESDAALDLEKVNTTFNRDCEAAAKKLKDSIDLAAESIRRRKDLDGVTKQQYVDYANEMKANFEKHGYVPMAAFLREFTIIYLKEHRQARAKATQAYGVAIDAAIRMNDQQRASKMLSEQKEKIGPQVICKIDCTGQSFRRRWNWALNADGSIEGSAATWNFEDNELVIRNRKYIDKIKVHESGKSFIARNQFAGIYSGNMIYP